jgi:hypothetical protein
MARHPGPLSSIAARLAAVRSCARSGQVSPVLVVTSWARLLRGLPGLLGATVGSDPADAEEGMGECQ